MKTWQKSCIFIGITWSSLHLIRDVSQDIGIKNLLSTPFVKPINDAPWWYLYIFNTYVYAIVVGILSLYAIKKKSFHPAGTMSLFLTVVIFSSWLIYWYIV